MIIIANILLKHSASRLYPILLHWKLVLYLRFMEITATMIHWGTRLNDLLSFMDSDYDNYIPVTIIYVVFSSCYAMRLTYISPVSNNYLQFLLSTVG
jgi:hypothetical protein